jgi:hypothetical protein
MAAQPFVQSPISILLPPSSQALLFPQEKKSARVSKPLLLLLFKVFALGL